MYLCLEHRFKLYPIGMVEGTRLCVVPAKLVLSFPTPTGARRSSTSMRVSMRPPRASASVQQQQLLEDAGIVCDPCGGKGWILCDFCNGQKTNVRSATNRIYRRCPSCKAVGCILCVKCKVFKCVTFPNYDDGQDSNL